MGHNRAKASIADAAMRVTGDCFLVTKETSHQAIRHSQGPGRFWSKWMETWRCQELQEGRMRYCDGVIPEGDEPGSSGHLEK